MITSRRLSGRITWATSIGARCWRRPQWSRRQAGWRWRRRPRLRAQKGPRVWLDLDQQELDDAYDQSKYAANLAQIVKRYATNSEQVRARLGAPKRLAYGPTPIEGLDLYPTQKPNAPVHVFIHGGAWRSGLAKDAAYQAETFVNAGAHYVAVDFNNVLETKGDLMPMADQVRRAVAWVYENAASFGGDQNRIYLSGHSSGGHLAGVVLTTDWQKDFGLPKDVVKGGLCCSGMFDLKPVRLSARSSYVKFTDEVEQALSSQRHLAASQLSGDRRLRHAGDAGIPAPEPRFRGGREGRRQAGRRCWSARATTTSRCRRRSPIPMACSAARRWSR